jgi:hypothetical protein
MMISVKITCIKKDSGNHENPYIAISSLRWIEDGTQTTGDASRDDMHNWVKGGRQAYVKDTKGDIAFLVADVSPRGTKFDKTRPDTTKADNLLSLTECR